MECERLTRLIKSWYLQIQGEALAPARMVEFMESHLEDCEVCLADRLVRLEVDKISKFILPQAKLPKAAEEDTDLAEEEGAEADDDLLNAIPGEEQYADEEDEIDDDSDDPQGIGLD